MIYIYDIEVFLEDWIVVMRSVDSSEHLVFANNNYELKNLLHQSDCFLCGFNNKHYDDWILMSIISGNDQDTIKKHSDYIIEGNRGWEYQGLDTKRRPFQSIDLRDDLPLGLSLKAIEGNIGANIVESSIDFKINRKLTKEELEESIRYCKTDVDNTFKLYELRKSYITSKQSIAKMKHMNESMAVSLTNAKLTAKFLDAKKKGHDDEFIYTPPETLRLNKYLEPLHFFREIDYKKKLKTDIAGVPHVYGWGGLHGAIKHYFRGRESDYKMVTIDVGSYYPSMMLVYQYISRNIPSFEGYLEVYQTRMKAKHSGDKVTADNLKLILNTCFGAMKNKFNDLYDPHQANAICITGMLLLTDLIEKLEQVSSFELIQSNTDGIIIRYLLAEESQIESIVYEWEQRTGMNMEYTVIHSIAQKDVNNYVMKSGETYLVKKTEEDTFIHQVTDKDKGKIKCKGGYVSLFYGGDFKNNSLVAVHKALVLYFMDGIPIEDSILTNNNLMEYQMIAKTGSTYDGTFHEILGNKVPIQRVNRVYATSNKDYGTIFKRKNGIDKKTELESELEGKERTDKIASLPEHCIIDNENKLSIQDIDKSFYIELAKKRINDYLGRKEEKKKDRKELSEMAAQTKNSFNKKLAELSRIMHSFGWEKDGRNMHQQYKYVSEAQYKNHFKRALDNVGLIWESNCVGYEYIPAISDKMHMVMATFKASLTDFESGEQREYEYVGSGTDNGDKALYKAYTGGLKFFLANTFLVAENNDPECDDLIMEQASITKQSRKIPVSSEARKEIAKQITNADGEASVELVNSLKEKMKLVRSYYWNGNDVTNVELHKLYEPKIKELINKLKGKMSQTVVEEEIEILNDILEKVKEV